jgi:hypothetical protein
LKAVVKLFSLANLCLDGKSSPSFLFVAQSGICNNATNAYCTVHIKEAGRKGFSDHKRQ